MGEPQPQTRADSWAGYGNSIGNGSIIVLGVPDESQGLFKTRKAKEVEAARAKALAKERKMVVYMKKKDPKS